MPRRMAADGTIVTTTYPGVSTALVSLALQRPGRAWQRALPADATVARRLSGASTSAVTLQLAAAFLHGADENAVGNAVRLRQPDVRPRWQRVFAARLRRRNGRRPLPHLDRIRPLRPRTSAAFVPR